MWRIRLFNLMPNFVKRIGCYMLRRLGYEPDLWLERFLERATKKQ